jgi:hypothetical protein
MVMATTLMVTCSMEDSGETILMVITMEIMAGTMGEMDTTMETTASTVTTQETCPTSPATSARILDTLRINAQRKGLMRLPNPIHSRRDKRITSMWRK